MKRIVQLIVCFFSIFLLQFSLTIAQVISAGELHTGVVCNNGSVKTWGDNQAGQLGNGNWNGPVISPADAIGLTGVKSIYCGGWSTTVLKDDSTVWTWGQNNRGQLGVGDTIQRNIPIQVPSLSGVVAVSSHVYHTLALKSDGTVWAWGDNDFGCIGNGTTVDCLSPVQVSGLSSIVAVATGDNLSLALQNDGTLWAWGWNNYGQLGDSTLINRLHPVQVHGISNVIAIAAGDTHCMAIKGDGTLWTWGYNVYGQLGDGTNTNRRTPILVNGISNVIKVSSGWWHSIALKDDGTMWAWGFNAHGELGNGTQADTSLPIQVNGMTGIKDIAGGLYHTLALKNDGSVWSWGLNQKGQLGDSTTITRYFPSQVPNLCYVALNTGQADVYMHGILFSDSSSDCIRQSNESVIPWFPVLATPGNLYSASNDTGYYSLGVLDSTNYSITVTIPNLYQYTVSNPCPASYPIYLDASSPHDTSGFDFGFDGVPCYQLRVDVTGNRKRRCFRNHTRVYYWNEGLIPANNVEVHVRFAPYDIPVSASMPFTVDPADSSLVFNIGTVAPWNQAVIDIIDSIACIPNITGLTQCTKAWILPANDCLIDSTTGPGWDHSSMAVTGACVNDTCRFVIRNNGSGDMAVPQQYRIYADNILVYTGSYQLVSGDSLVVLWVSGGATIRLEADQHPDHPGHSHPRYTLEVCGTDGQGNYSTGEVNRAPMDDEDVDVEIDCMQIRDSYDPNEKDNAPEGVEWAHYVQPNTPIDFTVHFQNTGSDTAYKVVVIDSLSNDLDLATLELGAASHPYSVSLSGQGVAVLKFTFSNINLSDSTTDELNSHGFVKYKITPKASTPLGTRINNTADIYFDYNFPVRTNTAFVTLGNDLVLAVGDSRVARTGSIIAFPNPTKGSITLETAKDNPIHAVTVYGVDGRVLKSAFNLQLSTFNLDLQGLSAGIYFLDCQMQNGRQRVRVVKY